MKSIYAIAFVMMTLLSYGQKSSLLQNVNLRAKELKHKLNKTGDSLIFNSDKIIEKVEIYNSNFEKKFIVNSYSAKIPLTYMPSGRYVTEVKLRGKLILITLLVEENMIPEPYESNPKSHITKTKPFKREPNSFRTIASKSKTSNLNESHNLFGSSRSKSSGIKSPNLETVKPKIIAPIKLPKKDVRFYWIVRNINKGQSSSKVMRMGEKDEVDRMIEQNKIDRQSAAGKRNELIIWEVYDASKFMKFQRLNADYANAKEADCFNVIPIYKSGN